LNKKYYDIFNYGSIAIVFIVLILMLAKAVPVEWFVPLAAFAIVLLIIRIFLRIYISVQNRKKKEE
jgi:cell division protein FtsW (lipid II flippase)